MKTSIIEVTKKEEIKFYSYNDLYAQLSSVADDTEWVVCNVENVQFSESLEANPFEGFGGDEFAAVEFSNNSGWTSVPLRYTALQSILSRAECFGNGIKRLFLSNKVKFAEHLNDYFALKTTGRGSKMLALIQDGKLSALHSGAYTPIPMVDVFEMVDNFVNDFDKAEFVSSTWTWEATSVLYNIVDANLYNVYMNLFTKYLRGKEISVQLFAVSSDVAETAVRFYPRFKMDSTTIPLNNGVAVKHIGKVTVETVENQLSRVFTAFEASCRNLQALADITINNKKNAMIKAFSMLNIPQKYAANLVECYDNTSTNALDIYVSMCEVLTSMNGKLPNIDVLNYEETLSRLITLNRASWQRFDIPGVVAWGAKNK